MNKKGFTLVELLVMLVVLGVISAIAIPNIMGILSETRINTMIDNANKMYDTLKIKETTKSSSFPKPTITDTSIGCVAIKLAKLGTADDYKPSIEGAEVNFQQSFIVAKKEVSGTDVKYKYYVRLIETKNSKNYGIELEEVNSLSKDSYKTNIDSITIPPTATSLNELVSTLGCTTVNYPA